MNYWEQRRKDARQAHEVATLMWSAAEARGDELAAWNWSLERKRLVAIYMEAQRSQ